VEKLISDSGDRKVSPAGEFELIADLRSGIEEKVFEGYLGSPFDFRLSALRSPQSAIRYPQSTMPNIPVSAAPTPRSAALSTSAACSTRSASTPPANYRLTSCPTSPRGFDARCCNFLRVQALGPHSPRAPGGTDQEILAWCHEQDGPRTTEECEIWNGFMTKRGWRDGGSDTLQERIKESKLEGKPIETFFDLIEYDEGRRSGDDPALAVGSWRP